jgi:acetyl esterase/lipase
VTSHILHPIAMRILILVMCFALPLAAQKITRNIAYTPTQTADLYQPSAAGVHPAIVYIHGGSWRSGSKSVYKRFAMDLAAQGYVGFAIGYDLHPKSFPMSWQQAREAIAFLRAHAVGYQIDPARILVAGDSAGGELAALLALAPEGPATGATAAAQPIFAALIFNGAFDLHTSASVVTRYLGHDCATPAPICDDASPTSHIHAGAPPFFIGHGTADHTVVYAEAQMFVEALQQHKDTAVLYSVAGAPHSYWDKGRYYAANLAAVEAFLRTLNLAN